MQATEATADSVPSRHKTAKPAAPYAWRAPSPPPILVPPAGFAIPIKAAPRYDNVDPASLSAQDLAIITQNGLEQVAHDSAVNWTYASRRAAQPILDYLYLGPWSILRNRQWLQEKGITMVLVARDASQASQNLMACEGLVGDMGIESQYVDILGYNDLTRAFPSALRLINDHMLRVYQGQVVDAANFDVRDGGTAINTARFRRGKVLVVCETGNERSATMVAAYLMAVFGMSVVRACQFLNHIRFCINIDDQLKQTLRAYEDILLAQRTVHRHELQSTLARSPGRGKRGIGETAHDDSHDEMSRTIPHPDSDQERFIDRDPFKPFVDN